MTTSHLHLSRRERQIMDVLYRKGSATAAEVLEDMPNPPSYSSVRALLRILEQKGHIKHEASEGKYIFMPTVPREKAKRSAIRHLVQTFFDGSPEEAVAALLDSSSSTLSEQELDRLQGLIDKARKGGRK
jgi:BlaI family transcriptional regulator, penicillinase repressor